MSGVNKATILGRLGQDVESRYTHSGKAVATISVATSGKWNDKEETEWHRVVLFGRLAEVAAKYLKKGDHAYFEGKIQTRKWQDQNGQDRYTTEIVARDMQLIGRGGFGNNSSQSAAAPQQQQQQQADDDIPF